MQFGCEKCNRTGHISIGRYAIRCECLVTAVTQEKLGPLYSPNRRTDSKLIAYLGRNVFLYGAAKQLREHLSAAIWETERNPQLAAQWYCMTGQALFQVRMKMSKERYDNQREDAALPLRRAQGTKSLLLMLNIAESNRGKIPSIIGGMAADLILERADDKEKNTWVVVALLQEQEVKDRYGEPLRQAVVNFKQFEAGKRAQAQAGGQERAGSLPSDNQSRSSASGDSSSQESSKSEDSPTNDP